jgi:hypothetical protein
MVLRWAFYPLLPVLTLVPDSSPVFIPYPLCVINTINRIASCGLKDMAGIAASTKGEPATRRIWVLILLGTI